MERYARRLLATTFSIAIGTGGSAVTLPVAASNDWTESFSPVSGRSQRSDDVSHAGRSLHKLKEDYQLGVDQLAAMLGVTRPTVYSWMRGSVSSIRSENLRRIEFLGRRLDALVHRAFKGSLGPFFRRQMDPAVNEIFRALASDDLTEDQLGILRSQIAYKLEGLERSRSLHDSLAGKARLIS